MIDPILEDDLDAKRQAHRLQCVKNAIGSLRYIDASDDDVLRKHLQEAEIALLKASTHLIGPLPDNQSN